MGSPIALIRYVETDIICLQEVAGLEPGDLEGLGYCVCVGPPRRGGGLATLVSRRLLTDGTPPPSTPQLPMAVCWLPRYRATPPW